MRMDDINQQISERLESAISIARQAGQRTLDFFQTDRFEVHRKADNSPVTQADLQAEQLMRDLIGSAFPQDAIMGEELDEQLGESGFRWILDPIDGTKSFITGVPLYSVLIGVLYEDQAVVGVIRIPGLDESVYASQGQGAWWTQGTHSPRPARVSTCDNLAAGTFLTTQIDSFEGRDASAAYQQLAAGASIARTWGDGYGYLLVATGRAEVMVDPIMNLWDAAPLRIVMEEAGGTFTDWQGHPTIHHGEGVATNGRVLAEVLSITSQFSRPE
jgi:histidinol phosphatase-like enzyme (inositol monophosphatase family)